MPTLVSLRFSGAVRWTKPAFVLRRPARACCHHRIDAPTPLAGLALWGVRTQGSASLHPWATILRRFAAEKPVSEQYWGYCRANGHLNCQVFRPNRLYGSPNTYPNVILARRSRTTGALGAVGRSRHSGIRSLTVAAPTPVPKQFSATFGTDFVTWVRAVGALSLVYELSDVFSNDFTCGGNSFWLSGMAVEMEPPSARPRMGVGNERFCVDLSRFRDGARGVPFFSACWFGFGAFSGSEFGIGLTRGCQHSLVGALACLPP